MKAGNTLAVDEEGLMYRLRIKDMSIERVVKEQVRFTTLSCGSHYTLAVSGMRTVLNELIVRKWGIILLGKRIIWVFRTWLSSGL